MPAESPETLYTESGRTVVRIVAPCHHISYPMMSPWGVDFRLRGNDGAGKRFRQQAVGRTLTLSGFAVTRRFHPGAKSDACT